MPAIDIHHVAIKTADLDATVDFYTKILGARKVDRPPMDFPGAWLSLGATMIHIYAGQPALGPGGKVPRGSAAVDHVSLAARNFHEMRQTFATSGLDWREFDVPSANLWQLYVHDPSGVLIELNFSHAVEPGGSTGPDGSRRYDPGKF
jgi:catechol 2,3-dioxygenase-like lactoylglutathione lyase family enzyme